MPDSTFTKTYAIPEENLVLLNQRLAMIAKRAKKLGFPPIEWSEVGRKLKVIKGHQVLVCSIVVSGVQPVLSDWSFQGKLEQLDDGVTLVSSMNGSVPKAYWDCKPDCDHCKTERNRRQTFILKNVKTDEFKQVGGSCLKDFLNNDDPQAAASYLETMMAMAVYFGELDEDGYVPGSGATQYIPTKPILTLAAAAIRQDGFISAKRGEEIMCMSTGQLVAFNLTGNPPASAKLNYLPCDSERAIVVEAWLLSELFNEQSQESTYTHNLRVLALLGASPVKSIPLMASAVIAYDRHIAECDRQAKSSLSSYVGKVSDKVVDLEVTKKSAKVIPGDLWGDKILYIFEDKAGNVLNWYSSGKGIDIPDGSIIHLSGTVKAHKEYHGALQTELTRVKVTEIELFHHLHNSFGAEFLDNKPAQKLMKRALNCAVRMETSGQFLLDVAGLYSESYVKPLLDIGADSCARDVDGNTVAHRAVWSENKITMGILREFAPEAFFVTNNKGETADSLFNGCEESQRACM